MTSQQKHITNVQQFYTTCPDPLGVSRPNSDIRESKEYASYYVSENPF